ncbi:hypothetical protein BD769DRAFT_1439025, partial [Suillus cothurnatus]
MTRLSSGPLYIARLLSAGDSAILASSTWKQSGQPLKAFPFLRHLISRRFPVKVNVSDLEIILINAKSSSATSPCMGHTLSHNVTWTPNHGKLLESASAWKKVAHPLAGTPIASTFFDSKVGLRQLSVRQTFTTFQRSALSTSCVTLSMDNKRILSGHQDRIISDWAAPDNVLPETPVSMVCSCLISRPFIISSHISLLPRLKFLIQRHVSIL